MYRSDSVLPEEYLSNSVDYDVFLERPFGIRIADTTAITPRFMQDTLAKGIPFVVSLSAHLEQDWSPAFFSNQFGSEITDIVDCETSVSINNVLLSDFFEGFDSMASRIRNSTGSPAILKLKDWPTDADLKTKIPKHFDEFMRILPLQELIARNGALNLAARIPAERQVLDLGPKLYIAYASDDGPGGKGTTPIHLDMTDAVNFLAFASHPADLETSSSRKGAVWDIFRQEDAGKLRQYISRLARKKKESIDDPIHDQLWYLNTHHLNELAKLGVHSHRIVQMPGDAIFIPAGCSHQVCNYQDCIKIAMDYVSPYNIGVSMEIADDFRRLSTKHARKTDLLDPKSILLYAVKHALDVLKARDSCQ
eukprot:jgi/Hompol1/1208/HPOL_000323-RA